MVGEIFKNLNDEVYIYIIAGFMAFMIFAIGWFWRIRHQQVNAIASILTVIGVLGTFAGIAWGLWNFKTGNTDAINASVKQLLHGLKFAFFTSIAGIAGSIAIKWLNLNKQRNQGESETTYSGATVDDLAALLSEILSVVNA